MRLWRGNPNFIRTAFEREMKGLPLARRKISISAGAKKEGRLFREDVLSQPEPSALTKASLAAKRAA